MKLRIFGRIFYDNQEPGRGKRKKGRKKASEKRRGRKKKENTEFSQEKPEEKVDKDETVEKLEIEQKPEASEKTELMKESISEQKADISQNTVTYQRTEESLTNQSEELPVMNEDSSEELPKKVDKIPETPQVKKLEADTSVLNSRESGGEQSSDEEELTFFERFIKKIADKIKTFFQKIRSIFQKIKDIFKSMIDGVFHIREKARKIKDFYYDKINNAGILSTLQSLKNILKHIRPKRLDVEFEFGTGDPCSTGQILGVLAVFFAYYGDSVKVIPNFEDVVYEGRVFAYGRIRLFTLLIICIKLKLDNNFNQMIKNFKQLKEDL